ncbi:MAG: DUF2155 domain-containing protein [Paracoccaceae bacterium]
MKRAFAALTLALCLPGALAAQDSAQQSVEAPRGELRWLDKVSGATDDLDLAVGESGTRGRLTIRLDDCRYPADNPSGDAYAHLTISDTLATEPVFQGWMIASSPALSALDHSRYDVWLLRCKTP